MAKRNKRKGMKVVTFGNWDRRFPHLAEDALKAVERLTWVLKGMIERPECPSRWIVELDDLRMGCEAIRNGLRENSFAEKILRPEAARVDFGKKRQVGRGRRPDAKNVKV